MGSHWTSHNHNASTYRITKFVVTRNSAKIDDLVSALALPLALWRRRCRDHFIREFLPALADSKSSFSRLRESIRSM
jgi:hypothetical protein